MRILQEETRQQLINKAKKGADYRGDKSKGRNRYARRVHSKISNRNDPYRDIDMNKVFKNDSLDFHFDVNGETNDYVVRLNFDGIISKIKKEIEKAGGVFNFRVVVKAIIQSFKSNDVYFFCSCPDFHYRIGYWASIDDLIVGEKETRPSNITNPDNIWGPACKHICLVLDKPYWAYKLASVITNYVNYMESHYKQAYRGIIYPALYGKEYELSDEQEKNKGFYVSKDKEVLGTDIDIVNKAQEKKGNKKPNARFSKDTNEPIPDDEENS